MKNPLVSRSRTVLKPGTRLLERYEVVEVIGRGGMSTVYRARDLHFPQLERWVAIKEMSVLRPRERDSVMAAFEREAHLLAQLRHPAIPTVLDYFTLGERAYLVLEFIEGKTLDRVIEEAPTFLPQEQVIRWAIELCDVLHYLHTRPKPIIFRDLKPSNIMVTPEERLVLIDFGIARLFDPERRGTVIGTEGYAPPEQYRGIITPLVDIYALGATMHHMLTKRDPRKEPPFSFAERPIRKINPAVSPALEAIVYRALAYRPEERFQSAAEMKAALEALLKHQAPASPGQTQTLAAPPDTAGLGATQGLPPTREMSPASTREFPSTTLPPDTQNLGAETASRPGRAPQPVWTFACEDEIRATAHVQGGLVFVGSYDFNVYALRVQDGSLVWKLPTGGGVVTRPISDGRLLFFGSEDHHLYAVRIGDAKALWRYPTQGPVRATPLLHGQILYFGSDDGNLYALHAGTGRALWKFATGIAIRSTPLFLNGHLYFGNEDGEFFCLTTDGELVWRYQARRAVTSSPTGTDRTVYFASRDGQVYALDADSGWVLWRFRMGKGTVASPVYHQGHVYIGAADGYLYCLRAETGKEKWRFQTQHQVAGSVLIVEDRLYFGSTDHHLYCLNLDDGSEVWAFATRGPITATPVTDAQKRLLFIGSFDRHLYALPLR